MIRSFDSVRPYARMSSGVNARALDYRAGAIRVPGGRRAAAAGGGAGARYLVRAFTPTTRPGGDGAPPPKVQKSSFVDAASLAMVGAIKIPGCTVSVRGGTGATTEDRRGGDDEAAEEPADRLRTVGHARAVAGRRGGARRAGD